MALDVVLQIGKRPVLVQILSKYVGYAGDHIGNEITKIRNPFKTKK